MLSLTIALCSFIVLAGATDVQQCPEPIAAGEQEFLNDGHTPEDDSHEKFLYVVTSTFDPGHRQGKTIKLHGQKIENLKDSVQLSPCKRNPCRLKKGSNQHISIQFTPEKDLDDVRNHVTANVLGVDVPFVGVDGVSICDTVENEAGEKASCPLKAGTKYFYKGVFPILPFYPSIEAKVHWALQHKEKDIICFEAPVKIV